MSAFIESLKKLWDPKKDGKGEGRNRAALAALRRGLGQPPGTVASMYPYVVPYVPRDAGRWKEQAHYIVAALFALYPEAPDASVGLGGSFGALKSKSDSGSLELRFLALLEAHPEDLAEHLRHAVSLMRSNSIPIDWSRLLDDVIAWPHPDRYVQRRWAKDFWTFRGEESGDAEGGAAQGASQ
jgi:CRISPR system Cascade subunit CasB